MKCNINDKQVFIFDESGYNNFKQNGKTDEACADWADSNNPAT